MMARTNEHGQMLWKPHAKSGMKIWELLTADDKVASTFRLGELKQAKQELTMQNRQDFATFNAKWTNSMVDINECKSNLYEKEYFTGPQSVAGKRDYMIIVGKHFPQYSRDFIKLTQEQIAALTYDDIRLNIEIEAKQLHSGFDVAANAIFSQRHPPAPVIAGQRRGDTRGGGKGSSYGGGKGSTYGKGSSYKGGKGGKSGKGGSGGYGSQGFRSRGQTNTFRPNQDARHGQKRQRDHGSKYCSNCKRNGRPNFQSHDTSDCYGKNGVCENQSPWQKPRASHVNSVVASATEEKDSLSCWSVGVFIDETKLVGNVCKVVNAPAIEFEIRRITTKAWYAPSSPLWTSTTTLNVTR